MEPSVCTSTSHLLVGGKVRRSRLPVLLGGVEVPAGVWVVRGDWLSACLIRGERLREEEYEVPKETLSKTPPTSDSDYVDSGEEGEEEGERQLADVDISAVAPLANRKVCSQTPPTLCLRLFILYCYSPVAIFSLAAGFLTDDLSIHNDQNGGGKYLGQEQQHLWGKGGREGYAG